MADHQRILQSPNHFQEKQKTPNKNRKRIAKESQKNRKRIAKAFIIFFVWSSYFCSVRTIFDHHTYQYLPVVLDSDISSSGFFLPDLFQHFQHSVRSKAGRYQPSKTCNALCKCFKNDPFLFTSALHCNITVYMILNSRWEIWSTQVQSLFIG